MRQTATSLGIRKEGVIRIWKGISQEIGKKPTHTRSIRHVDYNGNPLF